MLETFAILAQYDWLQSGRDLESAECTHIPLQVRQNSLNWRGGQGRTHQDIWSVDSVKRKGILGILKANLNIRSRNEGRREKDKTFRTNPTAGARPGSPQESEFTVTSKDWDMLKSSKTLFEKVKDWLTPERRVECEKAHTSRTRATPPPHDGDNGTSNMGGPEFEGWGVFALFCVCLHTAGSLGIVLTRC
ncbi:hypothetical protein AAF712_014339 [Marasmius tenuissimus]|uniref:Uncharacterized protein n=1 Tax=Marasmius tenuissimus TaxID=585030 RepID=A0ABR2ZDF5_9AGAR